MDTPVIHLNKKHAQDIVPVLRQSHSFISDDEARFAFLYEIKQGHQYRGIYDQGRLRGAMSWQRRGLYKHGVVEIVRFSLPEEHFDNIFAESLYDTVIANIDWTFTQKKKRVRKIFLIMNSARSRAKEFLLDKGFQQEAELKHHYHRDRNEQVLSLFV